MRDLIRCRYAMIALSNDLTDPKAGSLPVAVVGSAEPSHTSARSGDQFIFVFAQKAPAGIKDPVIRQLWEEVPQRLQDELSLGVRTVGTGRLLGWLSGRLAGQSAHVVDTGEKEIKASINDPASVIGEIVGGLERLIATNSPGPKRSDVSVAQTSSFSFNAVSELASSR